MTHAHSMMKHVSLGACMRTVFCFSVCRPETDSGFVWDCLCLSVYLSICLSVPVCKSACLSACLSTLSGKRKAFSLSLDQDVISDSTQAFRRPPFVCACH